MNTYAAEWRGEAHLYMAREMNSHSLHSKGNERLIEAGALICKVSQRNGKAKHSTATE